MADFSMSSIEKGKFSVVFLGTGVSTAVPNLQHIINSKPVPCKVCHDALAPGSKNKRNNVSIALLFSDETGHNKCVVIDVGKTMRDGCMTLFPKLGISEIAGIILTHGHADAMFGLDDVRDLQTSKQVTVKDLNECDVTGFQVLSGAITVCLNSETMATVKQCFGYLTSKPPFIDESASVLERRVALLDFNVIDSNQSFSCAGLRVKAFPVYHGGTYVSLGFSIGEPGQFVYISDVKIIPEESMNYLKSLPRIKVFVIDVLNEEGIFPHMGLHEALAVVQVLNPETVYFVGMSCSLGLHEEVEERLAQMAPSTHLAYDGLELHGFTM
jgi:phosphoribosyl 1,2-cyclic phosphodiesterase